MRGVACTAHDTTHQPNTGTRGNMQHGLHYTYRTQGGMDPATAVRRSHAAGAARAAQSRYTGYRTTAPPQRGRGEKESFLLQRHRARGPHSISTHGCVLHTARCATPPPTRMVQTSCDACGRTRDRRQHEGTIVPRLESHPPPMRSKAGATSLRAWSRGQQAQKQAPLLPHRRANRPPRTRLGGGKRPLLRRARRNLVGPRCRGWVPRPAGSA